MDLREQLQQDLGAAYTIERELGGGGMSRVFVADETRLGRKVVIKVLSPDLAQGLNVERFEREIRLAASLQQANIVPLHTAGDVGGLPYFTMPFIEGESARARLASGALPVGDVVTILRDVTRALAYAHTRGVVHRDIKPDNILLSGETAVVTDFGIAKAISVARGDADRPDPPQDGRDRSTNALTALGMSIGTPAYMAPEQVAGDPGVDQRVDFYALGCTGYELLAGQPPFSGRTPQQVLAAHLSETPPSVATLRPDTPPALAALIARLMEKDPARRPESATDVLRALDLVTTSSPTIALSAPGGLRRSLLWWALATVVVVVCARGAVVGIGLPEWVFPGAIVVMALGLPALLITGYVQRVARRVAATTPTRTPGGSLAPRAPSGTMATMALKASPHMTWRRAWRGGMAAIGAFIVLVGVVMTSRAFGVGPWASLVAAGKLGAADRIVLADFAAPPADSGLVDIIGEAVRSALGQSQAVHLVPPAEVAVVLEQMQQSRDARLSDPAVVHEVAQRANARAVLGGRLAPLGQGFAVSLDLTSADGSVTLASFQETAGSSQDLLKVIDKLTRELRGKVGESLRQVQRSVPLARATTPSLEALQKYSEAVVAHDIDGNYPRAIMLERQALAIDSTFALAWRKLAISLYINDAPQAQTDSALEHANRYADRLPDREKYLTRGSYYSTVSYALDRAKAIAAYSSAIAADSADDTPAHDLALLYAQSDRIDSATRYAELGLRDAPNAGSAAFLASMEAAMGRVAQARATLDSVAPRANSAAPELYLEGRYAVALTSGSFDSLRHVAAEWTRNTQPAEQLFGAQLFASIYAGWGALRASDSLGRLAESITSNSAFNHDFSGTLTAANDILIRDQPARGAAMLDSITATPAWNSMMLVDKPALGVATLYALAGNPDRAQQLLDQYVAAAPPARAPDVQEMLAAVRAQIAMARGRYDEAIAEFRKALAGADGMPATQYADATFGTARAYDRMGRSDSARAWFERYLAIPAWFRNDRGMALYQIYVANPAAADKRLGELYDAANDRTHALKYYGEFVDQWRNADPELQPIVSGVRKRMAEIAKAEGH